MSPAEPLGLSYLDALFGALRDAGQELDAAQRWIAAAEQARAPVFRLQALAVAGRAHAAARACLDDAAVRLADLGRRGDLPPPLDQIPDRIDAARAALRAVEDRLVRAALDAATGPLGQA